MAFTFSLLNDFRKANLNCKTTAYAYIYKLRRLNSELFPESFPVHIAGDTYQYILPVPYNLFQDRYREFSRVARQWRNIKQWKWAGVPYQKEALQEDTGSLALFCAACPQPGINLPTDWKSDPDELSYSQTLVSDGNFSAIHQQNNKARSTESLTAGHLYMVEEKKYAKHLDTAEEMKEVCCLLFLATICCIY